ncbi:MAG TPA: hypothetical protein VN914_17115 [Polyangia bacterium]|nr:hypothetical protein [Polyangia bacterium]
MRICLAALLLALGGCSSNGSNANSAGGACNLTQSSNTCLRCWAEKCPSQLDRCFGDGFHSGELVSGNDSTASCRDYSVCVQACGCLDGCFESCTKNIAAVCTQCQEMIFSPCRVEKCAAECSPTGSPSDGGS